MKAPRFLERVLDSAIPVLGGINRSAVLDRLAETSVTLRAGEAAAEGPSRNGFLLSANLAARIYPRIRLDGPDTLVREAEGEIVLINPRVDVAVVDEGTTATLCYEMPASAPSDVAVFARDWNVFVDEAPELDATACVPAALLAATVGMSEVFRTVFSEELGPRGRRKSIPFAFNLITLGEPRDGQGLPTEVDLGKFNLVGAGAIGQATAHTLACCEASATMVVADHESISLSNLQRYVLARDSDVGVPKVDHLRARLANERFEVVPVRARWSSLLAEDGVPTLVALDTPEARIEVQAALPGPIYNAWTQPADVGWSRHENFGEDPCLACLYWPDRAHPSLHEQIAAAFQQDPHRCLSYLVHSGMPVGVPLPQGGVPPQPGGSMPPEADQWLERPLLDDIAAAAGVDVEELAAWRDRSLADLYQEGICGGAILHLDVGEAPQEALVPLAHQSAFAGVMLATQLLAAATPELQADRPNAVEGRYDLLTGGSQVFSRPRSRSLGCLCEDDVFLGVYREKFGSATGKANDE